jgi:Ammonia permease
MKQLLTIFILFALLGFSGFSFADTAAVPTPPAANKGDTAWMIVATVLVILMVIPGLALFYGGMVRAKTCYPC